MNRISVVIPTYDTAEMTLACCRAVLASLPEGSEVIVADDGSRDGTAESMPAGVRIVRLEVNRGFASAANAGVAAAHGDIILLLNSDAIVAPDAISAMLAAFDRDASLGIAGARLLHEDGSQQWSGGRTPALAWMIGVVSGAGHFARVFRRGGGEGPRHVDWVSGAAMAFRAQVWRDAGPLNERFRFYCQDIEFCLRAREAGWGVRIEESARVTHGLGRTIGAAKSHDPARLWPDLLDWGASYYGRWWARIARVALVSVAALRVAWRKLRGKDAQSIARGLRALRSAGVPAG